MSTPGSKLRGQRETQRPATFVEKLKIAGLLAICIPIFLVLVALSAAGDAIEWKVYDLFWKWLGY